VPAQGKCDCSRNQGRRSCVGHHAKLIELIVGSGLTLTVFPARYCGVLAGFVLPEECRTPNHPATTPLWFTRIHPCQLLGCVLDALTCQNATQGQTLRLLTCCCRQAGRKTVGQTRNATSGPVCGGLCLCGCLCVCGCVDLCKHVWICAHMCVYAGWMAGLQLQVRLLRIGSCSGSCVLLHTALCGVHV
jgi:hypothetical protein